MEEFIRCYEKIYPKMYRTAYFYMKNSEEAKDAVQDAVLTAYEKWEQLKEKEKFEPWMMKILVNRCKRRMRTWFFKTEELEAVSPLQTEALSRESDFAMASAVKEAYLELSEEERVIVGMSVVCGYTGEEIACILNKNHSTVRSKYRRALQKMKKKLEE